LQIIVALGGVLNNSKMLADMKIWPPWVKGSYQLYNCEVPIALMMGDMVGHDELCCIKTIKVWI